MHKTSFIMKVKTGTFNTDFLSVVFIQFNSIEKNGTRLLTSPGNATLKPVLKHPVARQSYGSEQYNILVPMLVEAVG